MLASNAVAVKLDLSPSVGDDRRAHHPDASRTGPSADAAAPVIRRGDGCRVWDIDGHAFVEYGGPPLGRDYRPVCDALHDATFDGVASALPAEIERQAARAMLGVIDSADLIKFSTSADDAVAGATNLARAYTGREIVAGCADPSRCGLEGGPDRALPVTFKYNDLADAAAMFEAHAGQIACVILEAETAEPPATAYLHRLQTLCHEHGAVFVLDETRTGFRWHVGGAQRFYNLRPDLSTFGDTMASGFPVSALCGKRDIMRRAGPHDVHASALAACVATIQAYRDHDIVGKLERQGNRLRQGIRQVVTGLGIDDYFQLTGRPQALTYAAGDASRRPSQRFRKLFQQALIRQGVIAPDFVVTAAHNDAAIDQTIEAVAAALTVYKQALGDGVA